MQDERRGEATGVPVARNQQIRLELLIRDIAGRSKATKWYKDWISSADNTERKTKAVCVMQQSATCVYRYCSGCELQGFFSGISNAQMCCTVLWDGPLSHSSTSLPAATKLWSLQVLSRSALQMYRLLMKTFTACKRHGGELGDDRTVPFVESGKSDI